MYYIYYSCLSFIHWIDYGFSDSKCIAYNIFLFHWLKAEQAQSNACARFEAMSARGREELVDFQARRVHAFKKRWVFIFYLNSFVICKILIFDNFQSGGIGRIGNQTCTSTTRTL